MVYRHHCIELVTFGLSVLTLTGCSKPSVPASDLAKEATQGIEKHRQAAEPGDAEAQWIELYPNRWTGFRLI